MARKEAMKMVVWGYLSSNLRGKEKEKEKYNTIQYILDDFIRFGRQQLDYM